MAKSGTENLIAAQRKRGPTKTRSVLGDPRRVNEAMVSFFKGAAPLREIVGDLKSLDEGITSQNALTSLMARYAYDKVTPGHAALTYFSERNIGAIQAYLGAKFPTGTIDVALTEAEQQALGSFAQGQGPEGVSTSDVESALRKVGITSDTKVIVNGKEAKVVDGSELGADQYMRSALGSALTKVNPSGFRFGNLATITSATVQPEKFPIDKADAQRYDAVVLPATNEFNVAYKMAGKSVDKKPPADAGKRAALEQEIRQKYQSMISKVVDYNALLGQLGSVGDNARRRVVLDSELQNIKLFALRRKALGNHGVQL